MDLRQLRYFVAVAEERHFGRAAARLHMAQPPLSQQIRSLETALGVQLLRRTTRRIEFTDAGAAYLERARAVLAAVDEAGREARLIAAGSLGRLIVGCVGSVTYSLLPTLARALSGDKIAAASNCDSRLSETKSMGGSNDSEVNALTVAPCGRP